MLRSLLLLLSLCTYVSPGTAFPVCESLPLSADEDSVAELVAKIKGRADSSDTEWIEELADRGTAESLAGLIEVFDAMQSIYMRRAVMRGLTRYDEDPELAHQALEKLRDAATAVAVRQVRKIAVDEIASCRRNGSHYLRTIVDSTASTEVREWAMEHLAGSPSSADFEWYRSLYRRPAPDKKARSRRKKKDEEEPPRPKTPPRIRELAFGVVASGLEPEELLRAVRDSNRDIRVLALRELDSRDGDEVVEVAERFYGSAGERAQDRVVAAQLLAHHKGADMATRFAKDGLRKDTPRDLAEGLAGVLSEMDDPKVEKLILKQVGKGKGQALLFTYWSAARLENPKVDKALERGLKNKDPEVVMEAARLLGERGNEEALPALEKRLAKVETPDLFTALALAIGELRKGESEWRARLEEMTRDSYREVRNGALRALAAGKQKDVIPLLVEGLSHEDWSTRLTAAEGLAAIGTRECVGALCLRAPSESGRLSVEMGSMLFELTGKPYGENGRAWAGWWEKEGANFRPLSASELRKARREEEKRKLRRTTISEFLGIEIESHSVVIVVDISGSMDYPTEGRVAGEQGPPRIKFAKEEILKSLDGIDPNSLFNILAFSDRVIPWANEMRPLDGDTLELAKQYVRDLRVGGGTNLYGAIRRAFEEPKMDTLFLVSDGEPSLGDVTDPGTIRDHVARWNAELGVRIHSIAIGEQLDVLRWIAKDAGGQYIELR